MTFRAFDVDAYNARLARTPDVPYKLRARSAREVARSVPVLLESDVLPAVLQALVLHPKVAFAWRQNTGAHEVDGRYVQFAFRGCSDIVGMLKGSGRSLFVEVKRPGGQPTADQAAFIAVVNQNGGLAFVARGVDDVWKALA